MSIVELRVCSECEKVFYAVRKEGALPCPHCGSIINGKKSDSDIKRETRFLDNIVRQTMGVRWTQ